MPHLLSTSRLSTDKREARSSIDKRGSRPSTDKRESSRSRSRQRARSEVNEHRSVWDRLNLQKIGSWLKKDEEPQLPPPPPVPSLKVEEESNKENGRPHSSGEHASRTSGLLERKNGRRVVPGLPRSLTFKRMNSEKRDKLLEVPPEPEQRRATSVDRKPTPIPRHVFSPPPIPEPSMSAPDVLTPHDSETQEKSLPGPTIGGASDQNLPAGARQIDYGETLDNLPAIEPQNLPAGARQIDYGESLDHLPAVEPPQLDVVDEFSERGSQRSVSDVDDIRLQEELEARWILNLSMHFRDMSDREKFFLTYAEEPNKWRRVTVSCDYRQLEPDSLEADLKTLHYQRDKSARIYEAIRGSLGGIQFYDTVTNLKLETTDGRLHVHVTEDVNEIIPYPSTSAIEHLDCKRFKENAICFDSHISGFVYKVAVNNRPLIKKEIPGPDAVEEFLYEINALCSLQDSKSVIKFEGIIVDEMNERIKGLLISYADQGALVDMIYDFKPTDQLPWERREKWARQIVQGLSEIHEAGYVQGDFTLSNIVIDKHDDAKIIDINRRGCPVGWEPPELAKLIESGQRISIYIGVKSDLYQLGMVLWAIAEQQDEPERQDRPLVKTMERPRPEIPDYFRNVVRACMSDLPRNRPSAAQLLKQFPPPYQVVETKPTVASRESVSTHRSDKEYIDPATAVDLNDITQHRRHSRQQSSFEDVKVSPADYPASSGFYVMANHDDDRGRSPGDAQSYRRSDCSPYPGHRSVMSLDDSELENDLASLPASRETRWEQIYVDGDTKLVQRGCGDISVHDFATQEPKEICITTPPTEMESSFATNEPVEHAPLNFSALMPIEPQAPQTSLPQPENGQPISVDGRASFSDRVHQLAQAQPPHNSPQVSPVRSRFPAISDPLELADLELEVDLSSSVSTSVGPSRVNTGFSIFDLPERARRTDTGFSVATGYRMPLHQDSGFAEPEQILYGSEPIRRSLDGSIRDFHLNEEDDIVSDRLWESKEGIKFGDGVRGDQLEVKLPDYSLATPSAPISIGATILPTSATPSKPLDEKSSNTTIRPPSIRIPDFHYSDHAKNPLTPPKSGVSYEPLYIPSAKSSFIDEYLSPSQSREGSPVRGGSDLDDYLGAEIWLN